MESDISNNKRGGRKVVRIALILAVSCLALGLYVYGSRRSRISTEYVLESRFNHETMRFSVYLPPGYSTSGRRYPVLYLFHGFSDNHAGWLRHGNLRQIADRAITTDTIEPMIVVMPHTPGGFYGNRSDGSYRYEDYFFEELIPHVEKTFHVASDKKHRAVAGISMGGQGAFLYAAKRPDCFSSCYSVGGAFHFRQPKDELPRGENDLDLLLERIAERDVEVRYCIDCGSDDGLIRINEEMHEKMTALGIPHEFRTRPGGHTWIYWREALPLVLTFVDASFRE